MLWEFQREKRTPKPKFIFRSFLKRFQPFISFLISFKYWKIDQVLNSLNEIKTVWLSHMKDFLSYPKFQKKKLLHIKNFSHFRMYVDYIN